MRHRKQNSGLNSNIRKYGGKKMSIRVFTGDILDETFIKIRDPI